MMADLPGARMERFTALETELLIQAVKDREIVLYGDGTNPPRVHQVRQAWEDISGLVSAAGTPRTSQQCRKRYNDVRRRGKARLAESKRLRQETGGGTAKEPTPAEDINASTMTAESMEGFGGIEIGIQPEMPTVQSKVSLEEGQSSANGESAAHSEGSAHRPSLEARPPRYRRRTTRAHAHPFLQLQQEGFNMLERELSGMRQSVTARMDQLAVLLRPLGRIASSLERIAAAMERGPPDSTPTSTPVPIHLRPYKSPGAHATRSVRTRRSLRRGEKK